MSKSIEPTFPTRSPWFERWIYRGPRQKREQFSGNRIPRAAESAAIFIVATAVYLLIGEMAVRLVTHAPLLEIRDFRHDRAARTINQAVQYDSLLGWRLKSFITYQDINTLQYGFRSNGGPNVEVRPGGVLAVGSSFTAGSEVRDDETWPAHLGQITGWNVNNAGEGNYVADQIIMNGKQLLPLVHPQVLVVDLIPESIIGTGYSSYGWPKPYFTVENGALVQHNEPVPRVSDPDHDRFGIKSVLGHLAIADQFMTAFFSNSWFSSDGTSYATVSNDVVDVTCRLLGRLKQETDADNVRLILYLQFGGLSVASSPHESEQSVGVGECARDLHIATVDEFTTLRNVYEKGSDNLRKYYHIEPNGAIGHKSSFGNMQAAQLLEPAIRNLGISIDQKSK
jgi:hypothetical protein